MVILLSASPPLNSVQRRCQIFGCHRRIEKGVYLSGLLCPHHLSALNSRRTLSVGSVEIRTGVKSPVLSSMNIMLSAKTRFLMLPFVVSCRFAQLSFVLILNIDYFLRLAYLSKDRFWGFGAKFFWFTVVPVPSKRIAR